MADTTIECQICFKNIIEEAPLRPLCYDSVQLPTLSTFPIKAELTIDENPLVCNECKLKIDEEHQTLKLNENFLENVNLEQSFLTNSSLLVNEKNYLKKIKEESVEVEIKNENENIVKEECDIFTCLEGFTASDMLYYCYQCNYATSDKQILTNHIFTHLLKCNLCSYTTFDFSSLRSHEEVHFNVTLEENVLECYDCGYQSKSRTTSKFHVLTFKKLLNCNCIRNKSKNLRRRLCKPSEERLLSCDKCEYRCYKKSVLIQHNRTHTQEKPFKCNACDFCCNRAVSLKNHMYRHSGERPFSCNKCDYRCYIKSSLSRHNKTHTQEKPFKCNVCDFCCNRADSLKTHMYKHSGERPFSCDKCGYRCYQKSDLIVHNRTHTQEKPFKCNFCDFCCNRKVSLKIHMYKHSGEWPFSCEKCDYRCYTKSDLTKHMYKHSRERPFGCDKCDYRCYTKSSLSRHTNRTHSRETV